MINFRALGLRQSLPSGFFYEIARFSYFSCWASLLNLCERKSREKADHWWFHIHHVIQQYRVPADREDIDFIELIKVLQQFMESSSIGEFSERLRILASLSYEETIFNHVQNENRGRAHFKVIFCPWLMPQMVKVDTGKLFLLSHIRAGSKHH